MAWIGTVPAPTLGFDRGAIDVTHHAERGQVLLKAQRFVQFTSLVVVVVDLEGRPIKATADSEAYLCWTIGRIVPSAQSVLTDTPVGAGRVGS